VSDQAFDPKHFFDGYPKFVETSETGPWLDRLNARYFAMIHSNREVISGRRVLDLASHDGRFSFAALKNGASRVVGIEHDQGLVSTSCENMDFYEVPRRQYDFLLGDIFDLAGKGDGCDVVFCFGILYHINHHMLLLTKIAQLEPRYLIIDTKISQMDGAVIEFRSPLRGSPPPEGTDLQGQPSRAGLDAMLSYFGWSYEYFDWPGSGLAVGGHMQDYRAGKRVSLLVTCNEQRHSPEIRSEAVKEVLSRQEDRAWQWMTITDVASKLDIPPQTVRLWVQQAEEEQLRGDAKRT
jgi:SAM-dependent methyltransferase